MGLDVHRPLSDQLSRNEKIKIKSLLQSESGDVLRRVMFQFVDQVKERLLTEFDDPEKILRKREQARGVKTVWKRLTYLADEVNHANTNT